MNKLLLSAPARSTSQARAGKARELRKPGLDHERRTYDCTGRDFHPTGVYGTVVTEILE